MNKKISIITACYNSERTIAKTIESVLAQDYLNFEHIFIDGASGDGTLRVIESYRERYGNRIKLISEKDNGLYDAMNKGVRLAEGDIIGILNSDDFMVSADVLSAVAAAFERGADGIYGNVLYYRGDDSRNVVRAMRGKGRIGLGWIAPHATLYLTRAIYDKYGLYDEDLKISSDYDLILRLFKDKENALVYVDKYFVKMREGGLSTSGMKSYITLLKECYVVAKRNGLALPLVLTGIRIMRTISQKSFQRIRYHLTVGKNI